MNRHPQKDLVQQPIGWFDEHDPHGTGYRIMTENGMKTYDITEYNEYIVEKERVLRFVRRTQ